MKQQIDLNADLGEGCGGDADLMSIVTSCNIACGGHAGDAVSMRDALILAKANGVAAGAHPSFPDRENFGRTRSDLSGEALETALAQQVIDLKTIARELDVSLTHLKPHGALYNMAAIDAGLAKSIVRVLLHTLPKASLFGPPRSELERAAVEQGIRFVAEGFADRAYEADGQLRDRALPGAVLHDAKDQAAQALSMSVDKSVETFEGGQYPLSVATICVHGDTPAAVAAAEAIKTSLETVGINLCPPT
ncbi:MAG: 5-oxoprolinase subunit PxpA [Pseudomonadota bacterium]